MGVEKDLDSWWSPLSRTVGVTHKEWHPSLSKGEGEALSDVQRWDFVEEECFLSQEQGAGGLLLSLSIIRPL